MKKKSIVRRLFPWFVFLLFCAALVVFVGIPLYGQQEKETEYPPVISFYSGDGKKMTMENEHLLFEMDPVSTQFSLKEKESGRMWYSNPVDAKDDKIASSTNKAVLSSTLTVTYTTNSGISELNNYTYSIENGSFDVEQLEDGTIKVVYSVGKIERIYTIPQVITKERYDQFTDAMSKSNKKKVSTNYTLYEPSKLDSKANKDEIIAKYPSVTEQALYILKSDTNANGKAKLEEYFHGAGYTQEDYEEDLKLIAGENNAAAGAVFNVAVLYRLDGKDFVVEVPYSEIRYKNDYPITNISVLPMFGAANMSAEGFMLVPEGGGAIIRYNNGKTLQNTYYSNLYGWDYSEERRSVVSETKSCYPVFGMTGGGGSFICMIEGASSYAGVWADIAGRYNSYNYIYAKYNVLHAARYNVSGATSQMVYMFEKQLPQDTVKQRYRFLDSESYSDMALAYGEYLTETYPDFKMTASEDVPVSVELLGAIDKIVVKAGLPVNSVVGVTSFADAESILTDLEKMGVRNLNVRFSGWANGGVRQKVMTSVHVLGELGGEGGLKQLVETAKKLNVPLYFDGISCFAYNSGILNGFTAFNDAARFATREQVLLYPYSIVSYEQDKQQDEAYYLVKPEYAKKNTETYLSRLRALGVQGAAFRDIGSLLSGDLNPRNVVTREQVLRMNIELLKQARQDGLKVMIKEGNVYAVPDADLITDMSLTGNAYALLDEDVPFYQIALHGKKDYTGKAINLNGDYRTEVLKCAEYGAGLNFTFMAGDGKVLQETDYTGYYASSYPLWEEEAKEIITRYQKEMAGLNRLRITGHTAVNEDVAVTTYENGTKVYVNYGEESFQVDGVEIPACDYLVKEGDGV